MVVGIAFLAGLVAGKIPALLDQRKLDIFGIESYRVVTTVAGRLQNIRNIRQIGNKKCPVGRR